MLEVFHKTNLLRMREKCVCSCERDTCIFCELCLLISEFAGLGYHFVLSSGAISLKG